jgi:hypothetical protein
MIRPPTAVPAKLHPGASPIMTDDNDIHLIPIKDIHQEDGAH